MEDTILSRVMADQAKEAVAHAKAAYGIDLDYTPESIEKVERILAAITTRSLEA